MKKPGIPVLGGLLDGLLPAVIPLLLVQVRTLPCADKVTFAAFIRDLCQAYETGDRLTFSRLLEKVEAFPPTMRTQLNQALWENYEYAENQASRR